MEKQTKFLIYTDGACSYNPGPGAYAYIIIEKGSIIKKGKEGFEKTTNNRMELLAVIKALQNDLEGEVTVFSDSKYVVDAINKKWVYNWEREKWKNRKNKDLWVELLQIMRRRQVNYVWVEGHADNVYNNECDAMARSEIKKIISIKNLN